MSALTDDAGFKLTTLVEAQRGMTDTEVQHFLLTGQLPDLSELAPSEPSPDEIIYTDEEAEALLAGSLVASTSSGSFLTQVQSHSDIYSFKFDPNQPRDKDGRWTDGLGGVDVDAIKIPKQPKGGSPAGSSMTSNVGGSGKRAIPAVIYKKHADGTVVARSADGQRRMRWAAGSKKFIVEERTQATSFTPPSTKTRKPTASWPFSYEVESSVQENFGDLARMSDDEYKAAGYHLMKLPVSALVPTQEDDGMEWGDADEYGATGKPFVVDLAGELYLIDGHHRAVKAGPYGQLEAWVRPVELPQGESSWQETAQLNKTSAYNDLKNPDKWFEPGQQPTQTSRVDSVEPNVSTTPKTPDTADVEINPVPDTLYAVTAAQADYWNKYGDQYKAIKATPDEVAAIDAYTMNGFGLINKIARGDLETLQDPEIASELDEWDQIIIGLDSFIRKQPPLQEDVTLFRGIDGAFVPESGTWRAQGFTSTTWNEKFADNWASGESTPTVMEIRAKKGDRVWISTPGVENEALFPLDTQFSVISSEVRDGRRHVVVELAKPGQTGTNNEPSTSSQTPEPAPIIPSPELATKTPSLSPSAPKSQRRPGKDLINSLGIDPSPLYEKSSQWGGDTKLANIVKMQPGWSDKPQLVSSEQLDNAVENGWTELWRGVNMDDSLSVSTKIIDQMKTGDWHMGVGFYGNGAYFTARRLTAENFAGRLPVGDKWNLDNWKDGEWTGEWTEMPGKLLRVALDPDAKIADYDELKKQYQQDRDAGVPGTTDPTWGDIGRYAAMRGYDGLRVKNQDDGGVYQPDGKSVNADQLVLFNRSVLMMQDEDPAPTDKPTITPIVNTNTSQNKS